MNKTFITLAAILMVASISAVAQTSGDNTSSEVKVAPIEKSTSFLPLTQKINSPMAYPGNMWGTIVLAPDAPGGYQKYRIEGVIEQGADWFRFGNDKWRFNTYVAGEYVINSNSKGFSPVIGMKMSRGYEDGNLDLGLRYKYGSTYLSPTGVSTAGGTKAIGRVELFATYWFAWNLKK